MNYKFIENCNMFTLPRDALLNKLGQASETEVKVLLYAAAAAVDGSFDENEVQRLSGIDLTDVKNALQFWRGADVICLSNAQQPVTVRSDYTETTEKKPQKLKAERTHPVYSGEEISALTEKNTELLWLIEECEKITGKSLFNMHERNKIVAMYDYYGLSAEYILSVFNYCKKTYGTGSRLTVPYVEKTLFHIYDDGIDTDEKLRDYFKRKEAFAAVEGHVRRLFGLGTRKLTKKEEGIVSKWIELYKYPWDMIEYAYELTVNSTGEASLPYAGKIMDNWFKAGYSTLEQAKEAEFTYKKKKENEKQSDSSFDNDEFFEAALKRSYENLGKKSSDTNSN